MYSGVRPHALGRPLFLSLLLVAVHPASAQAKDEAAAPSILTVTAHRVANLQPASTNASLATALRFDPRVDLQSRGLPEGQADVSVRGGLFESTGFTVGALPVFDPQTGHYAADLPIDPTMLSAPEIATGIDNAIAGFNSTVATIRYAFAPIRSGGGVQYGVGSDDLRFYKLQGSHTVDLADASVLGAGLSFASSRGDGSRPNGDHEFERATAQLQHRGQGFESNLVYGYQDKFYGWPGAYTGFASLPETDHTRTHLALANHRRALGAAGWWEAGAFFRDLDDDYDFNRTTVESGTPGSFEHRTRSYGLSLQGMLPGDAVDWRFATHLAGDELVRSTDLTGGDFTTRRYARISVAPEKTWRLAGSDSVTLRGGMSADLSNRDSDALLPLLGILWRRAGGAAVDTVSLEYSATSQVPGYTALKSRPSGLFGGNGELGRERADTLAARYERETEAWYASATAFYRRDDDLVDWTFRTGAPFARQANAMDADVRGLELEVQRRWDRLDVIAGYAYLDKGEDYGEAAVDASYYALNYAEHRATLAIRYQPFDWLDVLVDNELRRQRDNPLRTTSRRAYEASLAVGWRTPWPGLRLDLTVDNLTNSNFQDFPGTPAPRRQVSLKGSYAW
jgi:vitamin B12 transporter